MLGFLLRDPPVRLCLVLVCLLSLGNTVSSIKEEAKKENGMTFLPAAVSGNKEVKKEKVFLAATELPAKSVDLSTLNLTELVNGMLRRALKDSKKFFSLLSITSYSSFAFHKFSVAIYNISSLKSVDPAKFPTRYCYCVNNRTNDLSDFTALLVDIIGNSTSYLTEIFKSTSILSVSQTNRSDCIFICVMTGKSGRNLSDFWEMAEKSPVINYTFTSNMSGVLATRGTAVTSKPMTTSQQRQPSTSPSRWSPSMGASALRTSPWIETTSSEGEQPTSSARPPEPPPWAMATGRSVSHTLPHLATRRVAGAPRATAGRQAQASTSPLSWDPTISEKKPGGPPWGSPTFTLTPPEVEKATDTRNLPGPPTRTAATPGSPAQPGPTSAPEGNQKKMLTPPEQGRACPWTWTSGPEPLFAFSRPCSSLLGTNTPGTQTPRPTKAPAPTYPQTGDLPPMWPFTPWEEPALVPGPHQVSRCPQMLIQEGAVTAPLLLLAIQKLTPCLMELCGFFQQCLCLNQQRNPRATRYCVEHYSWFLKNGTYICQRVKRVSHSHTLKQKCLENICKSV